jgi:hypothetical protein
MQPYATRKPAGRAAQLKARFVLFGASGDGAGDIKIPDRVEELGGVAA